ncbi:MAG TPA: DUF4331 family protein [Bacteroidota bacterium]|nr:DUF4331 family protein [Bacteroidota bacterium]
MKRLLFVLLVVGSAAALCLLLPGRDTEASSHREAPLISSDPLADNCDVYAFRSPDDTTRVVLVATYIPLELPEGGPNWTTFGQNVLYEIHVKNRTTSGALGTATDDITYRFTFTQTNEDPTTFFNIRLGKQNLKTTYVCQKSTNGGSSWTTIVASGIVPPPNIGPRSIGGTAGLATTYSALVSNAIANATGSGGEKIFCGPRDDPFFVDLGGIFDLGQTRSAYGTDPSNPSNARDGLAGFNTHAIVISAPISTLQKDGLSSASATSILDPNFVIGVWASASRQQITTLGAGTVMTSGPWVQVSRLGMPLTNEAIIPIGMKDAWNSVTPYSAAEQSFTDYFANPELALYMDDSQFGGAVPALSSLRVQTKSYPAIGVIPTYADSGFDFRNTKDGAFAVTHLSPAPNLSGTAFAAGVQPGLVAAGKPRLVDIFPVFYFGVPNLIPYQLATGKSGGPLSPGKPFIHNFLPITNDGGKLYGGDMLRLNMATPVTPRGTTDYANNARFGLVQAAVLGLTDTAYNRSAALQAIPHMDGFPNGRRLEDDITTIELQAVGGLVLAAVGLGFDDAHSAVYSDLASPKLVSELTYNAGPTKNDVPLQTTFPYLADPHRGFDYIKQLTASAPNGVMTAVHSSGLLGIGVPRGFLLEQNYPNPFNPSTRIGYQVARRDNVRLTVYNTLGQLVTTLVDRQQDAGTYEVTWDAHGVASGAYYYRLEIGGVPVETKKAMVLK